MNYDTLNLENSSFCVLRENRFSNNQYLVGIYTPNANNAQLLWGKHEIVEDNISSFELAMQKADLLTELANQVGKDDKEVLTVSVENSTNNEESYLER